MPSLRCEPCKRSFVDSHALQQHLDSPKHQKSLIASSSQSGLEQGRGTNDKIPSERHGKDLENSRAQPPPAFTPPKTKAHTAASTPLYHKTDIPGKGIGIVAASNIQRSTLIISERPLFTFPRISDTCLSSVLLPAICSGLSGLSLDHKRAFLSLHNAHVGKIPPFLGIVKTNAFGLGVDPTDSGIIEECSRFNHSCMPNAHFAWQGAMQTMHIRAIRDITEGEEITISYLSSEMSQLCHERRQEVLLDRYGFHCKCVNCGAEKQELARSDARKGEIGRLDAAIGDGILIATNPGRALKYCRHLLHLRQMEGQEPEIPRLYYDAFQMCVAHGDLARASALMKLHAKWKTIYEGDSEEVKSKKHLISKPESHRLYQQVSRRWRSKTADALDEASPGFEEWLWMRAEK